MNTIIDKVRNLVLDQLQRQRDTFEYVTSKIFTLSFANVDVSSISITKNGSTFSTSNYAYDEDTGAIIVTSTLTPGDILVITYDSYQKYSNSELISHIKNAIYYISLNRYKTFAAKSDNIIFPLPTEDEENLIAIIAAININGDVGSYRTNEISISFNTKDSKETRIAKTIKKFQRTHGQFIYIDKNRISNNETIYDRENFNVQ